MANRKNESHTTTIKGVPSWLLAGGINALMLMLLGAVVASALYLLNLSASISVPLIVAFVIGIISAPLVKLGDRFHVPRAISAIIVILIVIGVVWASIQITVVGVIDQAPSIGAQIVSGLKSLGSWLARLLEGWGVEESEINSVINSIVTNLQSGTNATSSASATANSIFNFTSSHTEILTKISSVLMSGVSNISGVLSSLGSFAFGTFIGIMLLYYLLTDYDTIMHWIGGHLGVSQELGEGLIEDASAALRGYFKGTTLTAVVVAIGIGIALSILKVPLVIPIMIVTFLTSYIPFFGAIISGVFACLIALGSGGVTAAAITLIVVLIAQNVLQAVVSARLTGDSLNLHPLVVLSITILGSIFAGLLGTTLAAPLLAMVLKARKRLMRAAEEANSKQGGEDEADAANRAAETERQELQS